MISSFQERKKYLSFTVCSLWHNMLTIFLNPFTSFWTHSTHAHNFKLSSGLVLVPWPFKTVCQIRKPHSDCAANLAVSSTLSYLFPFISLFIKKALKLNDYQSPLYKNVIYKLWTDRYNFKCSWYCQPFCSVL